MLTVHTFLASKKGDDPEDCQDSVYPTGLSENSDPGNVFAVSDGTSTSFFSRAWSKILTDHFAKETDRAFSTWSIWLGEAQANWQEQIGKIVAGGNASFFVVNGYRARKPAAATFVGFELRNDNGSGRSWRALVLGDSCLFLLTASGHPIALTLKTSSEFSSVVQTATSWPSEMPHEPVLYESPAFNEASCLCDHDSVVIASDALSRWMLTRQEKGEPVWGSILSLSEQSQFETLVALARAESDPSLENDDVGLVIVKIGEPHAIYHGQQFRAKPTAPAVAAEVHGSPRADCRHSDAISQFSKPGELEPLQENQPKPAQQLSTRIEGRPRGASFLACSILVLVLAWLGTSLVNTHRLVSAFSIEEQRSSVATESAADLVELRANGSNFLELTNEKDKEIAQLRNANAKQQRQLESQLKQAKDKLNKLEVENEAFKARIEENARNMAPPPAADTPSAPPK